MSSRPKGFMGSRVSRVTNRCFVSIRARSIVNLGKTSLLSVAEGVKNTATPFTMDLPVLGAVAVAQPAYSEEEISPESSEEESQSGTDAAVGETGIKSTSFLH